jgi:hypothetical protein
MTVAEFVELVRACRELGATRVEAHGFVCTLPAVAPAPREAAQRKQEKPMTDEERFEAGLRAELLG